MNEDDIFNAFLKTPLPLATEKAMPKDSQSVRTTPKIDLENLNPDLRERIARMQEDWKNNKELNPKGLDLPITSGARTAQQQEELKRRKAAGEPNIFTPADVPKGASMVHLNAIDLPTNIPDSFLAQYGLHRPLTNKGDPVHVQINPNSTYESPSLQGEDAIFNAFLKQPTVTIEELNPTETPTKPQDNIGNFSNFLEAAGHHAMMPLHGAANLIEQGGASLLNKIAPNSSIAKLAGNVAQQDINATRALEAEYQKNQPENLATLLGAVTGEVGPLMATGMGKAITKGGEIGSNLISRLGLGQTAQGVGNIGGQALASGGLSGLLGATQNTTSEKPYFEQVGQNVQNSALLGGAIPLATGAIGGALKAGGKIASNTLGLSTGVGATPIEEAFKAGKNNFTEFFKNLTGKTEKSEVLDLAKDNLKNMQQNLSKAYRNGMIDIKNDKSVLSFDDIDAALKKSEDFAKFKGQVTNESADRALQKVNEEVSNWKKLNPTEFHTPEGLDALKQKIYGILEEIPFEQKKARSAVDTAYNAIKSSIQKQAPTYHEVMKGYAQGQEVIGEIKKALSLGEKSSVDTGLRKLQSLMRNNANANYGYRLDLAKQLEKEGGNNIMASLAGQSLSSLTPRSLAAQGGGLLNLGSIGRGILMSDPSAYYSAALLPFQSPALVGASAYGLGKLAGMGNKITPEQANLLKLLTIKNYNKQQEIKE